MGGGAGLEYQFEKSGLYSGSGLYSDTDMDLYSGR